ASAEFDPEAYMNATGMIRRWGYPAEKVDVITEDGHILSMFRIRHGRAAEANSSCRRPAVIFSHGLAADSTQYIINPPESSPAFILADAGFDVFLLNHRGGTYSKRHLRLKPWDNKFWQFTMDELSMYDCPAAIDKAMEITGEKGVYWIGHSMGTSIGYMTIANNPLYNTKIKALFQLAPSGSAGYAIGSLQFVFLYYRIMKPIVDLYRSAFGSHEAAVNVGPVYRELINLCNIIPFGPQFLYFLENMSIGKEEWMSFQSRTPVYLSHIPSGTSTWNFLHWKTARLNRGLIELGYEGLVNVDLFVPSMQEKPPPYDYSVINVPVYHFWSRNDYIASKEDIDKTIMNTLRPEIVTSIEIPEYNHFDYPIALDVGEKVFNPIAKIVRSKEAGMCEQ
ncbi:hypothetical protein PMAYCL1PPCAC_25027, partial [Pristionchus mayeri]